MTPAELLDLLPGDRVETGWGIAGVAGVVERITEDRVFFAWEDGVASSLPVNIAPGNAFLKSMRKRQPPPDDPPKKGRRKKEGE